METVSEKIEILLNDFFKLQESGKEAFLKCFMMMLKEVELEIILEAMDFRSNFSLSYETSSAIDNMVVSEREMEDLIGKVLYLGEDEKSTFIRFLIMKCKDQEIDLILHILDSRRALLNYKMAERENNIDKKGIKGLRDVNEEYEIEDTGSAEVDTKIIEEFNNVDKKGLEVKEEYKDMKVFVEYNNVATIENRDVKMESEKSGRIYIAKNYEYLPCHLCSKSIKRIYMTRHTMSGYCAKSLVCDVCGKVFSSYRYLKNHKVTHKNEYKLMCDSCTKGFHVKRDLDRHVSRIHLKIPSEEIFQCSVCPKTFNNKDSLVTHEKKVHGERSYFCDLCPKAFQQSDNLKKHRRKHTGEKPFSCSECGKCFSESGNMKQHMKRHTPTTPQLF